MFPNPVVVVPWDFSDHARRALELAAGLTSVDQLRVICVLEEPNPYEPGVIWGTVSEDVAREKCAEQFLESIDRSRFGDLSLHVAFGDPAAEIARFAKARQADLILISSHGRTGVNRLMLGSVAESLMRTAKCPVLLLPNAWVNRQREIDGNQPN